MTKAHKNTKNETNNYHTSISDTINLKYAK